MLAPDELGSERLFRLVHYAGNGGKMTKKGLDEHEGSAQGVRVTNRRWKALGLD